MKRKFAVAVKAMIVKVGRVLVLTGFCDEIECSCMNHHQKWDLPSGVVHFFEHCQEGSVREIKEETDLKAFVGKPISLLM